MIPPSLRRFLAASLVLLVASALPAQTQGIPGTNDLSLNGLGSGTVTSCTAVRLLAESGSDFILSFSVSAPPGTLLVPLHGQCAAGTALVAPPSYTLDVSPFAVTLDPLATSGGIPLSLFLTVPQGGTWTLTFSYGANASAFAFQYGLLGATYPAAAAMSQAIDSEIRLLTPICGGAPVDDPSIGGMLSDDGAVLLSLGSPGFPFYGASYTEVHLNMNGNLTFLGPDADFSPNASTFLSGLPRIAPAWTDFTPSDPGQGQVLVSLQPAVAECEWFNVRRFDAVCSGGSDTNTFCVRLDLVTGGIDFLFGRMELCVPALAPSEGPLVGIGPGASLAGPGAVDLTAGPHLAAGPLQALYEDFTAAGGTLFDLAPPAAASTSGLSFVPQGPAPGLGPYLVP